MWWLYEAKILVSGCTKMRSGIAPRDPQQTTTQDASQKFSMLPAVLRNVIIVVTAFSLDNTSK